MALACVAPEVDLGNDYPGIYREVVNTPARLRNQVDLLFVVDNSENMEARQAQLSKLFNGMVQNLAFGRGLPDLHIGVVSTDMGVGRYGDPLDANHCTSHGDGGALIAPSLESCANTADAFLAYGQHDGQALANFDGALETAFACMSALGESGCNYEQPLEAMRSSLFSAREQGLGFVREDSVLGVVILTDEDDCSAFNSELFNPEHPRFGDESANFRCFQNGVICDGDDVYQPGMRNGCRPRPQSEFITAVDDYVQFLEEIKPNPADRIVTALIGDPSRVEVEVDAQGVDAELMAACKDDTGAAAYPGVRLDAFASAFGEMGETTSLCDSRVAGGLSAMVRSLRKSLGTTCLEGVIADVDPVTPGRQVDCRVYEQLADSTEIQTRFVECDNPGNLEGSSVVPCFSIQTGGETCGDFHTQLALQIHGRDIEPSPDTQLTAECRVSE